MLQTWGHQNKHALQYSVVAHPNLIEYGLCEVIPQTTTAKIGTK